MNNAYEFHYDAGHGWLRVDHATLAVVGLNLTDFSEYSYVTDTHMYLEEDCDAGLFIETVRELAGEPPRIVEIDDGTDSPIRSFRRNRQEG
jgi:hypothetical protein